MKKKIEIAVLTRKFQKKEDFFNMQYDSTVVSLFSYECVFSDCNSTQNVPKIIYTIHIYNTIYIMYNIYTGLTVTQIWQQNALFSKF